MDGEILLPQGAWSHAGMRPPFSFWQRQKENAPRPVEEKKRLDALRRLCASALTGVGGSVQAPVWAGLRARLGLLRFL